MLHFVTDVTVFVAVKLQPKKNSWYVLY